MTNATVLDSDTAAAPTALTPEGLSLRQEQFCRHYLGEPNATRAAVRSGYAPRSAATQGARLLTKPEIRARIRALQTELAEHVCDHTDALLAKLETIYERALEDHHFHAAGKAVEAQARLAERRRVPALETGK